jgi:TRAP-type C4-dicarboxylate transport system permease small subunit
MFTRFNQWLGDALSYVYAVIAVLTFGEVCARYFFNAPTQWTTELVVLLAALHYLISGPQAYALSNHIRITVLYEKLPKKAQYVLTLFERLVVTTVCGMVGYWAINQADRAISMTESTGTNWNTPTPTILKIVLCISLGLFAAQALIHLVNDVRRRNGS